MRLRQFLAVLLGLCAAATAQAKDKPAPAPAPSLAVPPLMPENTWLLDLSTGGRVTVQLRPDKAPLMVARVKTLTRRGFYDGLVFHRVIDGFMAQTGDPKGTGEGGSELPDVKAEFNDLPHVRGTVSAARSAADDSANSQFFIMFQPNLKLDGRYTPFGRVVSGMQYVDAVERGEPPANPSRIVKATIAGPDTEASAVVPVAAVAPAQPDAKAAAKEAKAAAKAQARQAKDEKRAAADKAKAARRAEAEQAAAAKRSAVEQARNAELARKAAAAGAAAKAAADQQKAAPPSAAEAPAAPQ